MPDRRTVMRVQVLGVGCPKCRQLAANVEAAARALGIDCAAEKVTDINDILEFDVAMTPALVVDGVVKAVGEVPSVEAIKALLR